MDRYSHYTFTGVVAVGTTDYAYGQYNRTGYGWSALARAQCASGEAPTLSGRIQYSNCSYYSRSQVWH